MLASVYQRRATVLQPRLYLSEGGSCSSGKSCGSSDDRRKTARLRLHDFFFLSSQDCEPTQKKAKKIQLGLKPEAEAELEAIRESATPSLAMWPAQH